MKLKKIFFDGIFANNPVLVQLVGMCSVLAVTTSVTNAIGMGSSVIFVVTCSNIVNPTPCPIPSIIDEKTEFFDAKDSALAKIRQFTTISGMKSPKLS